MNILLSIKPKYAEMILSGEKIWEFRKKIPKQPMDRVFIYATKPIGLVIGSFEARDILSLPVYHFTRSWEIIGVGAGISKEEFQRYFRRCKVGYAIETKNPIRFETPMTLADFGVKKAPQSWQYLRGVE